MQKIAKNRHLGTIAQICLAISSQLKHVSTIGKTVKEQYFLHMCLQCGELRPTNGCDLLGSLGHPSKFQRVSRLGFVTAATSLTGLESHISVHDVSPSPALVDYIYCTFGGGGCCMLTEFCQLQNSLCVPKSCVLVYWQRYCTTLEQRP